MNEVCAEVGEGGGWWYGGIIPGKFLKILYAKLCSLGNIYAITGRQNGSILFC